MNDMNKVKKCTQFISSIKGKGQRGAVAIMVALLLTVLVGIAALAVDVGYFMTARNELQNIADSAALAGAGQLKKNYEDIPYSDQKAYVCNPEEIGSVSWDVASKNSAAGEGGSITVVLSGVNDESDVQVGKWGDQSGVFTPAVDNPNAVKVKAHRDGDTPVITFFGRIFGIGAVPIEVDAVAALFPVVPDGKVFLPLGISEKYFFDHLDFCDKEIIFLLYQADDWEWHTNNEASGTADDFITLLDQLISDPSMEGPSVEAGKTTLEFLDVSEGHDIPPPTGGTDEAFDKLEELFNIMKEKDDGVYDFDEDPSTWTTNIVVYEKHEDVPGDELGGERTIVGFTTITIKDTYQIGHGSERGLDAVVKYTKSGNPRLVK